MEKDFWGEFPNQYQRQKDFDCSLGFAMTVIGTKWRSIILWHVLKAEAIRYADLKKSIPNISHKVFSQELKHLEMDGLIQRIVHDLKPPKVEYHATDKGKSLESILSDLCDWGRKHMI